ncbi:fucose-binding lectin II [Kosakonia pseudosacchari]|uniref:Calcium-mediated lectin domain-containing protein n=1 Tax=Kosakonia pseudosacchari TaxID=1646340 RepID=A0ABX4IQQ9_9ENTR|nr:fucose-binding lectin II [Kosakonia pseudosacchari]PDO85535.1 hypothetical protein BK796_13595 [Kosakonia pseudosacchari]
MSSGPVSGNGIAIVIPPGKVVFWSVLVQSSANQFIQLKDSLSRVVFTVQGASSSGGTPTQIGSGFFQADNVGDYTVLIGTNGGQRYSNVLWTQDIISRGASVFFGKYIFASEDSTDNDYNDSFFQLQWFENVG